MATEVFNDEDVLDPVIDRLLDRTTHRGDVQCASCRWPISSVDARIEMSGRHDHHFVNPLGYEFHIGCFDEALGCAISGNAAAADSWFPQFRWQYASCSRCAKHLGWYFQSSEGIHFYGLILDRILVES